MLSEKKHNMEYLFLYTCLIWLNLSCYEILPKSKTF